MLTHFKGLFHGAFTKDRQLAGGGGNNDIRIRQLRGYLSKQNRFSTEFLRQLPRSAKGAIGNHDFSHSRSDKMASHQFNSFPRSHQQGITLTQIGKNMTRQIHRGISHWNRIFTDSGIGTDPFGNRENAWK